MIFHNYEGAAPFILNETERNGVFAFLVGTGLSPSVRDQVKGPRENFRFWLGEIRTDHVGGGYELAKILFRTAHNKGLTSASGRLKMILLNGSAGDPAAVDRQDGAHLAADEYWRGTVAMRLIADWSRLKARGVSARAFEREPTAPIYWVANDLMALGVLDTFERTRKVPGVDTLIGCFNWTPWSLKKVAEGRISFVMGGHFMEVGTAMAMLFDHSRGRDFADTGLSYAAEYALVTERNVRAVAQRVAQRQFGRIDFRQFSRVLNPQRGDYELDPISYLRAME